MAAGARHRQAWKNDRIVAKHPHLKQKQGEFRTDSQSPYPKCPACGSPLGTFGQCTNCENLAATI